MTFSILIKSELKKVSGAFFLYKTMWSMLNIYNFSHMSHTIYFCEVILKFHKNIVEYQNRCVFFDALSQSLILSAGWKGNIS